MNIKSLDVHLLRCFEALVKERNVSRAAERLGLSQPAMSHSLARLRRVLNDPLFVRAQKEMIPTRRALDLQEPVQRLLVDVNRILALPSAFDPRTAQTTFMLTSTEYVEYVLAPALMSRLRQEAPGVAVEFRIPVRERMLEWMEQGEVDFRVSAGPLNEIPRALHSTTLFRDRLVCIAKKGHPSIKGSLTREQFFGLPHVRPRLGYGQTGLRIDKMVASHGRKLRVALLAQNFLTVSHAVARSDLIAAVPERVAQIMAQHLSLQVLDPPLDLPGMRIGVYWHERTHRQPSHRWFRQTLIEVAKSL